MPGIPPLWSKASLRAKNYLREILESDEIYYYSLKFQKLIKMSRDEFNKKEGNIHSCDLCCALWSYSSNSYKICRLIFTSFDEFKKHCFRMQNERYFRQLIWTESDKIPNELKRFREFGDLKPIDHFEYLRIFFKPIDLTFHRDDLLKHFKSKGCPCNIKGKCKVQFRELTSVFSHLSYLERLTKTYMVFKAKLKSIDPLDDSKHSSSRDNLKSKQNAHLSLARHNKEMFESAWRYKEIKKEENWVYDCKNLLNDLFKNVDSRPFRSPVDLNEFDDYLCKVKTPMDLSKIKESLWSGRYQEPKGLNDDLQLIFTNSKLYHTDKHSTIYTITLRLQSLVNERMSEIMNRYKQTQINQLKQQKNSNSNTSGHEMMKFRFSNYHSGDRPSTSQKSSGIQAKQEFSKDNEIGDGEEKLSERDETCGIESSRLSTKRLLFDSPKGDSNSVSKISTPMIFSSDLDKQIDETSDYFDLFYDAEINKKNPNVDLIDDSVTVPNKPKSMDEKNSNDLDDFDLVRSHHENFFTTKLESDDCQTAKKTKFEYIVLD